MITSRLPRWTAAEHWSAQHLQPIEGDIGHGLLHFDCFHLGCKRNVLVENWIVTRAWRTQGIISGKSQHKSRESNRGSIRGVVRFNECISQWLMPQFRSNNNSSSSLLCSFVATYSGCHCLPIWLFPLPLVDYRTPCTSLQIWSAVPQISIKD